MTEGEADAGIVKSDLTLLSILDGLEELDSPGVTELATHLGLAKGTVHKHLKTLEREECVVNDGGCYRLGGKFLKYGADVMYTRLCNRARPKVMELAEETDEMVVFSIKEADHGVFVYSSAMVERRDNLLRNGWRFELHDVGVGKVMLAELSDEELHDLLAEIESDPSLLEEIETIREAGVAVDHEAIDGVRGISAAVHDPERERIGAISIIGPARLLTEQRLQEEYAQPLLETADRINFELRY